MFSDAAQVALRFGLALVILALISITAQRRNTLSRPQLIRVAALGISFTGVVILYTIAATSIKLGNAVLLLYAGSIITSLLIGTYLLKERLDGTKLIAVALALVGLGLYANEFAVVAQGVLAAVAAGFLDGAGNGLRKTLRGLDRNTILLYQYGFGTAAALLILALSPGPMTHGFSIAAIITGAVFAVAIIGLGNLLLYGFQHFDVNVGTVILSLEIFFASLIGWLFFGEVPTVNELLGGLVIFIASVLSAVDVRALMRKPVPSSRP